MNTQESYRANYRDLRALTRYKKDRESALKDVCDARRWWFGGSWAQPASIGAQAALKVLMARSRPDALASFATARPHIPAEHLGMFLRLKVTCSPQWTGKR
jgi:hypothetical protein